MSGPETNPTIPLCPDVTVDLIGNDGNAFSIIARVSKAMKRANIAQETVDAFKKEAMSGDYDNVLRTCMKYVNFC